MGEPISVRIASNEAVIVFQLPIESISSAELNFTVHLQEKFTSPEELSATDTILSGVSSQLRDLFVFKGRAEGRPFYAYRHARREDKPSPEDLFVIGERARNWGTTVRDILQNTSELTRSGVEQLSSSLEQLYSDIKKFCGFFETLDNRWAARYLEQILQIALRLQEEEQTSWEALRSRYNQIESGTEKDEFEAIVQAISAKRAIPYLSLGKLSVNLLRLTQGEESYRRDTVGLATVKIEQLLRSDELEQETHLTGLLLNHKESLIDFLLNEVSTSDRKLLQDRLWKHADLLLQDDLFSLRAYRRQEDRKFLNLLIGAPIKDPRFA